MLAVAAAGVLGGCTEAEARQRTALALALSPDSLSEPLRLVLLEQRAILRQILAARGADTAQAAAVAG